MPEPNQARKEGTVRNTLIEMSNGLAGYYVADTGGGTTVTRSDIFIDGPFPAVLAETPLDEASQDNAVVLRNMSAKGKTTEGLSIDISGRPNTKIEDSCIKQRGSGKGVNLPSDTQIETSEEASCKDTRGQLGETANPNTGGGTGTGEFSTETVKAGGFKKFEVRDGEPLQNTLIDISAEGADCAINPRGSNWTVENVGIKGFFDSEDPRKKITPQVDEGGTGTIRNVYIQGTNVYKPNRIGNMWVHGTQHRGTLKLENVYFGPSADNNMYGSGPIFRQGSNGGIVQVDKCYFRESANGICRLGGDGSHVRQSIIKADKASPKTPFDNPHDTRGIWAKDGGTVEISNCDIYCKAPGVNGAITATQGGSANVTDCRVEGEISGDVTTTNVTGSPALTPRYGIPTSPEQAASGGGQ